MGEDTPRVEPRALALRFVGSGSEYFRIWIVNLLLTLLTLGLYYPFAKVRRLRYFYGATEVGGDPLSFHARPWKMLRGYLLVAALVGAYSLAGQVSPVAGLVAFVIMAAIWPALWHSSLRFRMANTGWRGLRFGFVGQRSGAYWALAPALVLSAASLAALAWMGPAPAPTPGQAQPARLMLLLPLLPALLLMLALPWMLWSMRRYQHGNYALGAERTRFDVRLWAFYGVALRSAGIVVLVGTVAGLLTALGSGTLGGLLGAGSDLAADRRARIAAIVVALLVSVVIVAQALVWPYVTARMQNLVWNGTRSQHLSFRSQLRVRPLAWLTVKNWLLIVFTLGLYFPFARVATVRLRLHAVTVLSTMAPEALVASAGAAEETAAGDAAGDMLGLDIGL
jgi:uncharacterized membrane protein YjgN (DUF898 family)